MKAAGYVDPKLEEYVAADPTYGDQGDLGDKEQQEFVEVEEEPLGDEDQQPAAGELEEEVPVEDPLVEPDQDDGQQGSTWKSWRHPWRLNRGKEDGQWKVKKEDWKKGYGYGGWSQQQGY